MSHYQQLFKRKGSNENGVGLKQRKDQWLHQNRGADETDSVSTPKWEKDSLKKSNSFKDYSIVVEKTPTKEPQPIRSAEAKGKLTMEWPPKKNGRDFESVQQPNRKSSISDTRRASNNNPRVSNNAIKLDCVGEVRDKVKALANSFQSEEDKTSRAEKFSTERPKHTSDKTFPFAGRAATITNDEKEIHKKMFSINSDNDTNKAKKFVHFARDFDDGTRGGSDKFTAKSKDEEQHKSSKPKDFRNVDDKNDNLPVCVGREPTQNKMHTETPEMKLKEKKFPPFKNFRCEVEDEKVANGKTDTDGVQRFSGSANRVLNHREPQDEEKETETKNPTALRDRSPPKKIETTNRQTDGGSQRKPLTKTNSLKGSAKPEDKNVSKVGTRSAGINALSKLFTSGGNDKSNKAEGKDARKTEPKKPGGGLLGRLLYSSEKETLRNAKQNETKDKPETSGGEATESQQPASTEMLLQRHEAGEKTVEESQIQSKEQGEEEEPKVSSLQRGSEQGRVEVSHALPQTMQVLPVEQLAPREMFENSGEQPVEESEVLSPEPDSEQQMVEVSEVPPLESTERMEEKSLLSPQEEKPCEDQMEEWTQEASPEQELKENPGLDSDSEPPSGSSSPMNERQECQSEIQQAQHDHESHYTDVANLCLPGGADTVPVVNQELVESADQSGQDGLGKGSEESIFVDPDADRLMDNGFGGGTGERLVDAGMEGDELSNEELFESNHRPLDHFSDNLGLLESKEATTQGFTSPSGATASPVTPSNDAFTLLSPRASTGGDIFGVMDVPSNNHDEVQSFSPFGAGEQTGEQKQTRFEKKDALGTMDELIVPSHQDEAQSSNQLGTSCQTGEENQPDLDIFGFNDSLTTESPRADGPLDQPSAFTEDFLGEALSGALDVSILAASDPSTSNSLSDLFGPDTSVSASPSVQADPFTGDFFEAAAQWQPVSQSSDVNLFMDSFFVSDNSSTEKAAENGAGSNSWMDDLLG